MMVALGVANKYRGGIIEKAAVHCCQLTTLAVDSVHVEDVGPARQARALAEHLPHVEVHAAEERLGRRPISP